MDVECPKSWNLEELGRQHVAVGRGDAQIRLQSPHALQKRLLFMPKQHSNASSSDTQWAATMELQHVEASVICLITVVWRVQTSRAFTGVSMTSSDKPQSSASCATGDGCRSLRPRPLARSGCVTTAAIWHKGPPHCNRPCRLQTSHRGEHCRARHMHSFTLKEASGSSDAVWSF